MCAALDYETGSYSIITHYRLHHYWHYYYYCVRTGTIRVVAWYRERDCIDSTTRAPENLNRSAHKSFFVVELCGLCSDAITNLMPSPIHLCTSTSNRTTFFVRRYVCLSYSDRLRHPYLSFVQRRPLPVDLHRKTYRMQKLWFRFVVGRHLHLSHQFMRACGRCVCACGCVTVWASWIFCYCRDRMVSYMLLSLFRFLLSSFDHKSKSQ